MITALEQIKQPAGIWADDREEGIDLDFFWRVIYSRRWLIFTITALAFTFSTIRSLRLPDVYTARAAVLVEAIDQSAFQNPELLDTRLPLRSTSYLATRAEIIRSRPVLEEAARQLKLAERYQLQTDEQGARMIFGRTTTSIVKDTQIIEIIATDGNPKLASEIANAVAEAFVKESWRERLFISDQILKWFPDEADTLARSNPIHQLRKLERTDVVEALPSIAQNSIVQGLKRDRLSVDAEIKELSSRYTSEHPRMKELEARAMYLDSELKLQIEKIISGLKAGLAGEFGVSNVRMIEPAQVPSGPSGPRRLSIILVSTLVALFGSIAFSSFLFYLDQTVRSEDDVRKMRMTFLGYLPQISGSNHQTGDCELEGILERFFSNQRLADEVTNLRASILFSMPAERSKLVMCTSAMPGDGKTAIVSLLGLSLAEAGEKVLLIDGDMRKPHLHEAFKIENQVGLSNCLVGSHRPKDAIQAVSQVDGLYVLTAGEKTPNPPILLGSVSVSRLLEELETEFTRIIFDVPPALHIADGLILAGKVHGTILVFRNGRVHRNVGEKLKERIVTAGGVIIGCVVNRVDYRNLAYPYYRYYASYEGYYRSRSKASDGGKAGSGSVFKGPALDSSDSSLATHSSPSDDK